MPRIPESIVEQIKARADVLEVVSEVVQLNKRGRNFMGRCPFHDEKTPSFSVSPERGIYHCFGCGKGGNAVSFVMEYEKVDYVEALKRLAQKYHIPIDWKESSNEQKGFMTLLYEIHNDAVQFYHKQIFTKQGKNSLDYLKFRGFDENIIKKFTIGHSLTSWDGLLKHVDRNKYSDQILENSGLFIKKKDGTSFFDRFRNRIMFPIKNISGRTIAFGGRTLDPDEPAKYMNSPETKLYNKRGVLYGFEVSKESIRKSEEAILVEGYTDFLRIFSAGFENVVAGSGTALNPDHAKALKTFAKKVVLCYDGDEAGRKATERAGYIFLKAGFDVNVMVLPDKEDPDSFLQKFGNNEFIKKKEDAQTFIGFLINRNKNQLESPAKKSLFIETVVKEIAEIENALTRDFIVKSLSEKLGINEERIFSQLKYYYRNKNKSRFGNIDNDKDNDEKNEIHISTAVDKAEYTLLTILISQNSKMEQIIIDRISSSNFKHGTLNTIAEKIINRLNNGKSIKGTDLYDEEWNETEKLYLSKLIIDAEPLFSEEEKVLKGLTYDCIEVVLISRIDNEIQELRQKIKEADSKGEDSVEFVIELIKKQKNRKLLSNELWNS